MAASTITRTTWTNDTGTPTTPVGDGTILNNARLQDIYAAIDQLFSGAGSYTTLRFGGLVAVEGFGTSAVSAGGTGTNRWQVRNTTSGTANRASFDVGNNTTAELGRFIALSSAHTPASYLLASGVVLEANGAGGLSIACTDAAGDIRFYTGATPDLRLTISDAGVLTPSSLLMHSGFLAYNSADDTGVANGTAIDFDTEVYDEGGDFASDTFTAPATGRYRFDVAVQVSNVSGGAADVGVFISNSGVAGAFYFVGFEDALANGRRRTFAGGITLNLAAGDTVQVVLSSTANQTIDGDSGSFRHTWFSGRRVL